MAGSATDVPPESNRTDNVSISEAGHEASHEAGQESSHEANREAGAEEISQAYHSDTIIAEDSEDESLENEFTRLRDILARRTEGFRDGESDPTSLNDTLPTDKHNKLAILSDAIRYIQYLELRERHLHEEKTALEDFWKGKDDEEVE